MGEPVPLEPLRVVVAPDAIYISELEERDPAVVALLADADNPEVAVGHCLQVGARAINAADASLDSDLVEKRFDSMADRMDRRVAETVEQISESAEHLLDEESGALPATLAAHREQLESLLGDTFDPDSKKSVLAAFETVMADAHREQVDNMRRMVSLDDEESPLLKMKREIVHDVGARLGEALGEVRDEVNQVSEKVAVNAAVAPVVEITTAKGFSFEDVVHAQVESLAVAHGDLAEQVGSLDGASDSQKGDEVVMLNTEDTRGLEGRIAIEAKDRKLSMRKTMGELDASLTNRGAQAAIAVFRSQDQAPTSVPFQYFDTKAIVVLDENDETGALRLAYMWARWVTRRSLAGDAGQELDRERVESLIEDARRVIGRVTTIRRYHTTARRNVDLAADEVTGLKNEVDTALLALQEELLDEADRGDSHA